MRVVLAMCLVLMGTGCTGLADLQEMQGQRLRLVEALERDLGVAADVGLHTMNGTLRVDVILDSRQVTGLAIGELETRVLEALARSIEQRPDDVFLVLRVGSPATRAAPAAGEF